MVLEQVIHIPRFQAPQRQAYNQQVNLSAPETLLTRCLVSKQFYRLEVHLLNRYVVITPKKLEQLSNPDTNAYVEILRPNVVAFARDVLIKGSGYD